MLQQLTIRDFVIVDRLELSFLAGFGALTGETGAGKSILIDALALALGERADAGVVRAGCDKAEVAATFAIGGLRATALHTPGHTPACMTYLVEDGEVHAAFVGDTLPARLTAATAGDDYQLLFALAPDQPLPVPATRIGSFSRGEGINLTDAGAPVELPPRLGFQHG